MYGRTNTHIFAQSSEFKGELQQNFQTNVLLSEEFHKIYYMSKYAVKISLSKVTFGIVLNFTQI